MAGAFVDKGLFMLVILIVKDNGLEVPIPLVELIFIVYPYF